MNTTDFLTIGLRLFFWLALVMAFRQASWLAIVLCLGGFLVIEKYLDDLTADKQLS